MFIKTRIKLCLSVRQRMSKTMVIRTKSKVVEVLHKEFIYTSASKFPEGQLPTAKDVNEKMLYEKKWPQRITALYIVDELIRY